MRKVLVWGFVVVTVGLLFTGAQAERTVVDGTAAVPVPRVVQTLDVPPGAGPRVQVTNFPTVQLVGGSVNVGNLPAVQEVTGTVSVDNLPLDEAGNLRIAGDLSLLPPATKHFVGITTALVAGITIPMFGVGYPILSMNRVCQAEFQGTTVCTGMELGSSVPAPPEWSGGVLFVSGSLDIGGSNFGRCLPSTGQGGCLSGPQPVICCGY